MMMGSHDNEGVTLLKPEWFVQMARRQGHVEAVTGMEGLLQQIRQVGEDADWKLVKDRHRRDCGMEQGLLKYRGKVYVPKQLRTSVIRAHHDSTDAGHPGQDRTLELITHNYWWPAVQQDVHQYVRTCGACQRTKTYPARPTGLLIPNPIATEPWEEILVDLITGLPDSQGYDAVMVVLR